MAVSEAAPPRRTMSVRRPPTTFPLVAGAVLVFYTDGIVERRGEDLDVGLARLCATVTTDSPETVCRTVMHTMVGSHGPEDDVAIVALRRTDEAFA